MTHFKAFPTQSPKVMKWIIDTLYPEPDPEFAFKLGGGKKDELKHLAN